MGGNDRWIACFACTLFAFISISSQVFIFWPWLFGSFATSDEKIIDSFNAAANKIAGFSDIQEDGSVINEGLAVGTGIGPGPGPEGGMAFGYLSVMWANLNVQALLYLVPFNFSLVMLCWNYYLTMMTDPGSPPLNWNPPIDGSSIEYKRTTHTPRYCRTCDAYKPPRTHHCRTCKRCVLKMDHHCPWVQNCIGYFNYGHFVRFILWTTIATFICAALLVLRCWEAYENEQLGINRSSAPTSEQIILIVVDLCLDGSVFFGISILATYHLWCISSNTTTIESWEKDRVLTLIRRGKIRDIKCPYNQGLLANVQEVLGQNPLLWLWPQPMLGDGLRFKVRSEQRKDRVRSRWSSERDEDEEDGDMSSSSSSSRSNMPMRWLRPYDGTPQHARDELVDMV